MYVHLYTPAVYIPLNTFCIVCTLYTPAVLLDQYVQYSVSVVWSPSVTSTLVQYCDRVITLFLGLTFWNLSIGLVYRKKHDDKMSRWCHSWPSYWNLSQCLLCEQRISHKMHTSVVKDLTNTWLKMRSYWYWSVM